MLQSLGFQGKLIITIALFLLQVQLLDAQDVNYQDMKHDDGTDFYFTRIEDVDTIYYNLTDSLVVSVFENKPKIFFSINRAEYGKQYHLYHYIAKEAFEQKEGIDFLEIYLIDKILINSQKLYVIYSQINIHCGFIILTDMKHNNLILSSVGNSKNVFSIVTNNQIKVHEHSYLYNTNSKNMECKSAYEIIFPLPNFNIKNKTKKPIDCTNYKDLYVPSIGVLKYKPLYDR